VRYCGEYSQSLETIGAGPVLANSVKNDDRGGWESGKGTGEGLVDDDEVLDAIGSGSAIPPITWIA
jgi:hypothetical protein